MQRYSTGILLIVDDEQLIRNALVEHLSDLLIPGTSAKIVTAPNGKEALALIRGGAIDAVLSDIQMPVMNGLELLCRVRAMGLDTPFVFITGFADKDKMREALRLGATDFLEKPFKPQEILDVMSKALGLGLAIRQAIAETEALYSSENLPEDAKLRFQKMKQAILVMRKYQEIYTPAEFESES